MKTPSPGWWIISASSRKAAGLARGVLSFLDLLEHAPSHFSPERAAAIRTRACRQHTSDNGSI